MWGLPYRDSKDKYSRMVGRAFSDIRKTLNPPPPRRKTFHSLRHTFSSTFTKYTESHVVSYFMGHSTGTETFDRYTKYDDYEWLKQQIDKLTYSKKVEKMFLK